MRITILIFAILISATGFSQSRKELAKRERLNEIIFMDFIVSPSDYLLSNCPASEIDYIEFKSGGEYTVYACITQKDGFDKDYSIGQIFQYKTAEYQASYYFFIHMKDGSTVSSSYYTLDFSNGGIPESEDYEEADYDVEGEPFCGTWDGIEVVAL